MNLFWIVGVMGFFVGFVESFRLWIVVDVEVCCVFFGYFDDY